MTFHQADGSYATTLGGDAPGDLKRLPEDAYYILDRDVDDADGDIDPKDILNDGIFLDQMSGGMVFGIILSVFVFLFSLVYWLSKRGYCGRVRRKKKLPAMYDGLFKDNLQYHDDEDLAADNDGLRGNFHKRYLV